MRFVDQKHKRFYDEKMESMKDESYHRALIYTLGMIETTRNHFDEIVKPDGINSDCLNAAWQTSSSLRVTRLAFNLFNGFKFNVDNASGELVPSSDYTPLDLFCDRMALYMFEAVRIRYPEYFNDFE